MSDVNIADDGSGVDPSGTGLLKSSGDILDFRRATIAHAQNAITDPDATAERAARAIKLSRAVNTEPEIVVSDVDRYAQEAKAAVTAGILNNNKYLREYIRSKPLGAELSQDDWDELDEITKDAQGIYIHPSQRKGALRDFERQGGVLGAATRALIGGTMLGVPGFGEGFGAEAPGAWTLKVPAFKDDQRNQAIYGALGMPVEGALRTLAGGLKGVTEFARGVGEEVHKSFFPEDQGGANYSGRQLASIFEWKFNDIVSHTPSPHAIAVYNKWLESANTRRWLETGKPYHADVMIDEVMRRANERHTELIADLYDKIQANPTYTADPQSVRDILRLVHDGDVSINGPAVLKLYGDKEPVPGDGLLGDIPGIAAQLELARTVGGDIHIPFPDYMTYVKPDQFEILKDWVKVTPAEITKGEAELVKEQRELQQRALDAQPRAEGEEAPKVPEVKPVVEEIIPTMRASAGLEPFFSVGDRALRIEKREIRPEALKRAIDSGRIPADEFKLLDENGKSVGWLEVVPFDGGKRLYVDNIGAFESKGLGPNSFGNALTRSIARQLKEAYPQAEMVGGFRISGAREKAGTTREVWIKFDEAMASPTAFREIVSGSWREIGPGVRGLEREFTPVERKVVDAVNKVLDRLVPKQVGVEIYGRIEKEDGGRVAGVYQRYADSFPFISISLEGRAPAKTARHEAIHHLRQYGFLKPEEWAVLERAAREGNWIGKHRVEERWEGLDQAGKLEEAVAEEFKHWEGGGEVSAKLHPIFERIKELLTAVRDAIREAYGREPTAEEIFALIEKGEVGRREGNVPLSKTAYKESVNDDMAKHALEAARGRDNEADILNARGRSIVYDRNLARKAGIDTKSEEYAGVRNALTKLRGRLREIGQEPKFSIEEPELPATGTTRIEDRPLFRTPGAAGLNEIQARRFNARLTEQRENALRRAQDEAEDLRRDILDEWRHQRGLILTEVEGQMRSRPEVAADLMLARGDYYGSPLAEKPRISFDDLTPEQRAGLPKNYITKKGVRSEYTPDELATMVGFPTGDAMIASLIAYNEAKLEAKMSANAYIKRMAEIETDRIMADEMRPLNEQIADRVNDHLASAAYQELLAQDTLYIAERANLEAPLDKGELRKELNEIFEENLARSVSADSHRRHGEKLESVIKTEMLGEDWAAAYKTQQTREAWHVLFREAVKFEKERKAFNKLTKKLAARQVKGLDIDFQDQIQDLMLKAGLGVRRSQVEIDRAKSLSGQGSLADFYAKITGDGYSLDISEDILAGNVKPIEEMSVGEFREFHNALQSLNYVGRVVNEQLVAGRELSFKEFRDRALANITSLPFRTRESEVGAMAKFWEWDAVLTRTEAVMKDLDLGKEMGPMVNAVIRPLASAKHNQYKMEEELVASFREIQTKLGKKWTKSLHKELPNDWFMDPQLGGNTPFRITKANLIQIMLNWGNRGNRKKFVESWGSSRLGKRATKAEAAAFEQRMEAYINEHATKEDWDFVKGVWGIYKGYRAELERLWRNTTGTQPRMVDPLTISTPFGDFEGGYYPLVRDKKVSGEPQAKIADNALFGPNYFSAATPQNHMKDRTAASYYIDFNGDLSNIVTRMHQVIHDIAYREPVMQVREVLKDKAIRGAIRNHYGVEYDDLLDKWLQRTANGATIDETALKARDEFIRRVRMNTVTYALPWNYKVLSTPDVGMLYQIVNYWGPGYKEKKALAHRLSKEIPHAMYNIDRDFHEAMQRAVGEGKMDNAKQQAVRFGFWVVTYASREFRTATFITRFNRALREGKTEADAAAIADTYVREQHGTAALHDLPALMASGEMGRMLTMFYGYWNTMYNWQRNISGDIKRGDYLKAVADAWGSIVVGALFGAFIVNEAKDDDTVADWLLKGFITQPLGTIPILREGTTFITEGYAPRIPFAAALQSTKALTSDMARLYRGEPMKDEIKHITAFLGLVPGLSIPGIRGIAAAPNLVGGLQIGRTGQGIYDYYQGRQAPKDIIEWSRLLQKGEAELKHRSQ